MTSKQFRELISEFEGTPGSRGRLREAFERFGAAIRLSEPAATFATGRHGRDAELHVLVLLPHTAVRRRKSPCNDCDCDGLVTLPSDGVQTAVSYCLKDIRAYVDRFAVEQSEFESATRDFGTRVHFVRQQPRRPLSEAEILRAVSGIGDLEVRVLTPVVDTR